MSAQHHSRSKTSVWIFYDKLTENSHRHNAKMGVHGLQTFCENAKQIRRINIVTEIEKWEK